MAKLKEGEKLVCVPCGREVVITNVGISGTTTWCCGRPMGSRTKTKTRRNYHFEVRKKRGWRS
ncbi:MAG: hypothetical protein JSW40_08630 [Candidatus Omnitrophota bacterium]|nr:MAG: hypothetical protein JSW40_08630 [Candidatus Omnitrophota bacterium]